MKFDLCSFQPDHGMNPEALARYRANRLRVVPEVSYSPHARRGEYNPRLDLVLFVNGIPTATLELKSAFKQSVENAKRQYRHDRPTEGSHHPQARAAADLPARRAGPLRREPAGGGDDHPAGRQGDHLPALQPGHRGRRRRQSPAPGRAELRHRLPVGRGLRPGRLAEGARPLPAPGEDDQRGLPRPAHHQGDADLPALPPVGRGQPPGAGHRAPKGPGQRYLVQHSAGSGKSNSIAWVAHQLAIALRRRRRPSCSTR
ncbi:MAG: type I restriction endonuclease [Halomonas sp.]|uniref:type I restriction endonuclease n=1 Tax=Halomonas sp. TaxID=1486246 RepID=UPI002ACF011E|nr:type I restriction endonuclease [Halomonas sp.]MDZ7852026.1 type I restriction endonuclease [Halomonas sp.]